LQVLQVAGLHRAVPSTALDKVFNCGYSIAGNRVLSRRYGTAYPVDRNRELDVDFHVGADRELENLLEHPGRAPGNSARAAAAQSKDHDQAEKDRDYFFHIGSLLIKYVSHNNSAHGCVPGTAAQFGSVSGRDDSTAGEAAGAVAARRDRV
jgi:hypothetical protein